MQVLDLCMAPEGYSAAVFDLNPTASIDAVSLPDHDGGQRALNPFRRRDPRVQILFMDITMLATEYGVDLNNVPTDHPNARKCSSLYEGKQYDLFFCGGQVLRTQKCGAYRELCKAARFTNAQLTLGLQRIKPGRTLITLLHKLETWHTMMLIRSFSTFATIKSSFRMAAKDI
jgi:hypothetical protein